MVKIKKVSLKLVIFLAFVILLGGTTAYFLNNGSTRLSTEDKAILKECTETKENREKYAKEGLMIGGTINELNGECSRVEQLNESSN